ncbi:hypothetical protein R3P38DRAFT_2376179, partial [Favolaschia claudopus]
MPSKPGRKPKAKRNIAGLRNQKPPLEPPTLQSSSPSAPELLPEPSLSNPDSPDNFLDDVDASDKEWDVPLYTEDGLKETPASDFDSDMDIEGEDDYSLDPIFLDDEVFLEKLLTQATKVENPDADEEEWVPARVRYQRQRRKQEQKGASFQSSTDEPNFILNTERGAYKKGPDMASKSARSQRRHREAIAAQQKLTAFGFSARQSSRERVLDEDVEELVDSHEDAAGTQDSDVDMASVRSESARSAASSMSVDESESQSSSPSDSDADDEDAVDEEGIHEWELEAEVDSLVLEAVAQIKSWEELREQIKKELKKKGKSLRLAQINQLTIIRNFATL